MRLIIFLQISLLLSVSNIIAQNISYGLLQDVANPLKITAVAYPDFNSDNVTISTAVFTFLLPAGTATIPSINPVPSNGHFENITGVWTAQLITPAIYQSVGLNAYDLKSQDIYQVVLQDSPELEQVAPGEPISLFSFVISEDCLDGKVNVLQNDGDIQQAIRGNLQANFNNQMSISVDDQPSRDLYIENDPFSVELNCPLQNVVSGTLDVTNPVHMLLHPNPTSNFLNVLLKNHQGSSGGILKIYDVNDRVHFQGDYEFHQGDNPLRINVGKLIPGTYFLLINIGNKTYQEKFIKVNL